MNVRWTAVLTGFAADLLISALVLSLFPPPDSTFATAPDLGDTRQLALIVLGILSTALGGYVAGRMAQTDRWLNGLLVGVVGVLLGQVEGPLPRVLVVASAIGCLAAALGGALSRYPSQRPPRSSGQP